MAERVRVGTELGTAGLAPGTLVVIPFDDCLSLAWQMML